VTTGKAASDDSKFRMILLAAKRARQIQGGAKPLVHTTVRKSTRVAQEEIRAGVLPYEVIRTSGPEDTAPEEDAPEPKKRK
jgi:DNA-directed RNA polymerase subunit omega